MGKLMKAEFYKLQKLPSIRMIFLFVLVVGVLSGFFPYTGYQVYIIGLVPELYDMVLISVFTAVFLCTEFFQRTFGNAFLCGNSRWNVLLAKFGAYFHGLLALILLPLLVSTSVATMRNGFGADWDVVTMEMAEKLFFYLFYQFSMAGFAILIASIIHKPIGTLGISVAGIYLMSLSPNFVETLYTWDVWMISIIKTVLFLSVATFIFIRGDLK